MSGDTFKRREIRPGVYQCGCFWEYRPGFGDVLVECVLHKQAGAARIKKFERERAKKR